MAPKQKGDSFANFAAMNITESAANTFTSGKFQFPFSIMDKMGLIIQRVEYDFPALAGVFAAASDTLTAGLSAAATISDVDIVSDPLVIDIIRMRRADLGTPATGVIMNFPLVKDFTNLAGGGLLVAPSPLYAFIKGISAGAAGQVSVKIFYTYLELSTDDYWQMVESRRIISST